jgi:hypothetical protein
MKVIYDKTYSEHHTKWGKTEIISSKIKNKTGSPFHYYSI